jgi:hypothetical protein
MRITLTEPQNEGTYAQEFGWRVEVDGIPAYSGNERGARTYAAKMRARAADETRLAAQDDPRGEADR